MGLAEDLRQAVLQAALQGKLTEQLETDSNVDEVLMHIAMYREEPKECKNQLNLQSMDIKIPDTWRMVKLNNILSFVDYRGKTPKKLEKGIFLITASNIKKGYMDYSRKEYISEEEYRMRQSRGTTKKGDLLFTTEAPLGNAALCDLDITSCGQRIITMQAYCENTVCLELFMYFILSSAFQNELLDNCTGTTAKGIKADKLKHLLLPYPPIEEQQRIVDKINEIMPKINEYEKIEKELEVLKKEFPTEMKNSLLHAAVQGKLTEQLESDSSVDELLKSIGQEKEELLLQNKIKKEKTLSNIEEEELPFEIPNNWRWVRLGNISTYGQSKEKIISKDIHSNTWVLDLEDIEKETGRIISKNMANKKKIAGDKVIFKKDDILYSKLRPYLLKILVAPENGICTPELVPFRLFGSIDVYYIMFVLKSPYINYTVNSATYGMKMPRVGTKTMLNLLIPIPPIEEQQRIVKRLNALLPLSEQLIEK